MVESFPTRGLKCRGYRDPHPHPHTQHEPDLFGGGKGEPTQRPGIKNAWREPWIELNPPNAVAIVVLDCDDGDAFLAAMQARFGEVKGKRPRADQPSPSYVIHNKTNDHSQAGWILRDPVHFNLISTFLNQK